MHGEERMKGSVRESRVQFAMVVALHLVLGSSFGVEVEGLWPSTPCPVMQSVSSACADAQAEVCAKASVHEAFGKVFKDSWQTSQKQFRPQCFDKRQNCTGNGGAFGDSWDCCELALDWAPQSQSDDLKGFVASATNNSKTDICLISGSVSIMMSGYEKLRIQPFDYIMPVAVSEACTQSDRQFIIANLAQNLGMTNFSVFLPQPSNILGGSLWWDKSFKTVSGIKLGC